MKYYYALGWGRSNFLLAGRALIQSEHDLIKNKKIKTVPFFSRSTVDHCVHFRLFSLGRIWERASVRMGIS